MTNKIQFIPLGGGKEVGANSYYINWNNEVKILLDCGIKGDGPTLEGLPDFTKADTKPDFIIISHAHNDHIGALPFAEKFFLNEDGKILMTNLTKEIALPVLTDSGKIMQKDEKRKKFSETVKKLYSYENIDSLLSKKTISLDYNQEYSLSDKLKLKFFDAGHVLGSACIYLTDGKTSLLYTGDFNDSKTNIHQGINLPKDLKVDILITESTNGEKKENLSRQEKINKVSQIINKTLKNKGIILFPSFALGRTQEVLLTINKLKNENIIDKDTKVFISAGLSKKLTEIYSDKNKMDFGKYELINFNDNLRLPRSSIYIVTSGFFTKQSLAGVIAEHIKNDENSSIIFPSSFAYRQQIKDKKAYWFENPSCFVDEVDFSAHSSLNGIISLIKTLKPKQTVLIHGDPGSIKNIKNQVKDFSVNSPENGEELIFYGKDFCENVYDSLRDKSYIITVGTSLQGLNKENKKTLENDQEAKKYSAELNTLLNIEDLSLENTVSYLIFTEKSREYALIISKFLEEKKKALSVLIPVKFNLENDLLSHNMEMSDIISCISRLLSRCANTAMIFSGGFKFEAAISYLLSNIYNKDVYYKHEGMDLNSKSLLLQKIPIMIDENVYFNHFDDIKEIINTDYDVALSIYNSLPDNIKNIFTHYNKSIALNNYGVLVYYKVKSSREKKSQSYNSLESFKINKEYVNKIKFEDQTDIFPSRSVDNIEKLKSCVSSDFLKFMHNIITQDYVKRITFGKTSIKNNLNQSDIVLEFLKTSSYKKYEFEVSYKGIKQKLLVELTDRKFVSDFNRIIDMNPETTKTFKVDLTPIK